MIVDLVLLVGMTIAALGSVLKRELVKAAIALALASIILSVLMFRLASPMAAVFELSVCAGLITVIFVATIGLTKQRSAHPHPRAVSYIALPAMLVIAAILLVIYGIPMNFTLPAAPPPADVRNVLWNERQVDLVGQVLVILAGFFGVVVLFKERIKPAGVAQTEWKLSALPLDALSQPPSAVQSAAEGEPVPAVHERNGGGSL